MRLGGLMVPSTGRPIASWRLWATRPCFDWDGTLLDSREALLSAWHAASTEALGRRLPRPRRSRSSSRMGSLASGTRRATSSEPSCSRPPFSAITASRAGGWSVRFRASWRCSPASANPARAWRSSRRSRVGATRSTPSASGSRARRRGGLPGGLPRAQAGSAPVLLALGAARHGAGQGGDGG